MKRLYRKIGVGILVVGLALGGAGGLGGSVAHANLGEGNLDKLPIDPLDKEDEFDLEARVLIDKGDDYQQEEDIRSIIYKGRDLYVVLDVNPSDRLLDKLSPESKIIRRLKYDDFMREVKKGSLDKLKLKGGNIYRLDIDGIDILIKVL